MTAKILYEWCYETLDDGDIVGNDFEDNLSSFNEARKTDTLCLVRNEGDEINGVEDRFWAYVKDGKLPEYFEDGGGYETSIRVPQRFHKELKQYLCK